MGSKKRSMSRRTGRKGPKKSYRSSSKRVPVGMRSFNGAGSSYEKKFWDTPVLLHSNATVGEFVPTLTGIQQNTNPFGRIGRKITVTNVNGHFKLTSGTSATTAAAGQYRIILGIDKQANGAAPLITDILSDLSAVPPPGTGPALSPNSFRNMFNVERFVILKDKLITLNRQAQSTTAGESYEGSRILKLSWKGAVPVLFNSDGYTVSDITSNNFFMCMLANSTGGGGADEELRGIVRVKYTDL